MVYLELVQCGEALWFSSFLCVSDTIYLKPLERLYASYVWQPQLQFTRWWDGDGVLNLPLPEPTHSARAHTQRLEAETENWAFRNNMPWHEHFTRTPNTFHGSSMAKMDIFNCIKPNSHTKMLAHASSQQNFMGISMTVARFFLLFHVGINACKQIYVERLCCSIAWTFFSRLNVFVSSYRQIGEGGEVPSVRLLQQ